LSGGSSSHPQTLGGLHLGRPDKPGDDEVTEGEPPARPPSPFTYPAFRAFWAARLLSTVAGQVQTVAVGWQVYEIARRGADIRQSALYLGLIGLAEFLPIVLLTLPAGEMADRRDRKTIVAVCMTAQAVCVTAFLALTLRGAPPFWSLFVLAALFGAAGAFLRPAYQAIGPMLVPREVLPRAIAVNSLAFQVGAIAGPGVGGLLVGVSPAFAYGAALVLFLISALALLRIRANTRPQTQPGSRWALMKEGLVWVWRTRIVFGAISLDLFAVLLGGATALMPAFARDILHVGPEVFGVMRAAPAVGAGVMAVVLTRWQVRRRAGMWMLAAVAVFGVATVVFGLSRLLWLTLPALAILGASDMISVYIRSTLIQIVTPDAMRGRVAAVSMLFVGASNELGEFESGIAARFLGVVGAAVFGGLGSIATVGLWSWWFPDLRKADRLS
jgi:MFS family permease